MHKPHLRVHGIETSIIAKQEVVISCHLSYYWLANSELTWKLRDETLAEHSAQRQIEGNIANYTSTLERIFSREEDRAELTCSFSSGNDAAKYIMPMSVRIDLLCEWVYSHYNVCLVPIVIFCILHTIKLQKMCSISNSGKSASSGAGYGTHGDIDIRTISNTAVNLLWLLF